MRCQAHRPSGASLRRIAAALKHPDESVRVYAAKTILDQGDPSAGVFFLPLLQESSRQVLNLALQYFAKVPCAEAYKHLEALSQSNPFNDLDEKRQRLCFKALLRASPQQGTEFINRLVQRWVWPFKKDRWRKKSVALSALAHVSSPEAQELLKKLAGNQRSPLAEVAKRTLQEMQLTRKAPAPGGAKPEEKPVEVERV
jgi:HEAT repeat protein